MKKALKIVGYIVVTVVILALVVPLIIPIPPAEDTLPVEQLADPDSQFIEINGLKVHYKIYGSGEPYIFLLHGFGASTYSWRDVAEPLAQYGTVIAYDRPAFGLTERVIPEEFAGENPYTREAQVDLVVGLMDAFGAQQAILVGNSAGGTVSVDTAMNYPERVQALVLVDAAIYAGGGAPPFTRWLLKLPQVDRLGPLFVRNIRNWGMDLLNTAWHDPSRITPEELEGYQKPLRAENWDRALWELTKASRSGGLVERLDELEMPVLVVTGDDDRVVPTEQSLQLAEDIPGAELAVFEACGHVPQEECPDAFMQSVGPFIEGLKN